MPVFCCMFCLYEFLFRNSVVGGQLLRDSKHDVKDPGVLFNNSVTTVRFSRQKVLEMRMTFLWMYADTFCLPGEMLLIL